MQRNQSRVGVSFGLNGFQVFKEKVVLRRWQIETKIMFYQKRFER